MNKTKELANIGSIKMAVFDLDGTLLNSKGDLSNEHIQALIKAKHKGLKIVIASGRIYPMLQSYIKRIGVVDYVISANGASIDQIDEDIRVQKIYIDQDEARKVVDFCKKNDIECLILKREASFYPDRSERLEKFLNYNHISQALGYEPMELKHYNEKFDDYDQIEKLLINEKNEINMQKLAQFIESNTNLKYTKSGKLLLDVSSQGVSKEEALKKVCEFCQISLDEVITFGDYDNDIGMMRASGFSVALNNASTKALEAADYITLSNDDHGVSYVLNKLMEMGKF
jgi:Cof subfamily protein (haloacid dehalogenase superfamily)